MRMREFTWGEWLVRIPEDLDQDDHDDIKQWFGLILKQAQRRVPEPPRPEAPLIDIHSAEAKAHD